LAHPVFVLFLSLSFSALFFSPLFLSFVAQFQSEAFASPQSMLGTIEVPSFFIWLFSLPSFSLLRPSFRLELSTVQS
jgi:hypothetical protein